MDTEVVVLREVVALEEVVLRVEEVQGIWPYPFPHTGMTGLVRAVVEVVLWLETAQGVCMYPLPQVLAGFTGTTGVEVVV